MNLHEVAKLSGTKPKVVLNAIETHFQLDINYNDISLQMAKDIIKYFYDRGLRTEDGSKLIDMPYLPHDKYYRDTHIFTNRKKTTPEKSAVQRLQEKIGGKREVKTPAGNIDLLTDGELIECKSFKSWKSAIGQLLVYGLYYPCNTLRLHLYGKAKQSLYDEIVKHCNRWVIEVSLDEYVELY
jgi:hypothetical protein